MINGLEPMSNASTRPRRRRLNGHEPNNARSELTSSHQINDGRLQVRNTVWDDLANKLLPPEHTEYIIKQLERRADPALKLTYVGGVSVKEPLDWAPVLKVGLTFLPGADKPQVARIEQIDMASKKPDQKDASWRVATAGALLMHFDVSADLQIIQTDQTSSILARAEARAQDRFQDQMRALSLSSKPRDTVTIDSEHVKIVNDLRTEGWDLEGLLVEVDGSSLIDLMVNFRHIIVRGGRDMTFDQNKQLLETMIEDARRLCIRSPILFRMSTRARIISSSNTRYGIDHGPMFRTLTTSKGIKEIITWSAAYYNSLDPTGTNDTTQAFIRPRFLQMIVLLLSLLNNNDLEEIQDFLEATYGIKANRRDLELLFLKVIPLVSINPRVFLKSIVPAIEGFPLDNDLDHVNVWNVFVKRMLREGYLLPGTIADLGQDPLSWVYKWPHDGVKSTSIFDNLQYSGRLRTMNDVSPIVINPSNDCKEVTVMLTDGKKYTMSSTDLEMITCMTPGGYTFQETVGDRNCVDLVIRETSINAELYHAIRLTNSIVSKVNFWLASSKKGGKLNRRLFRKQNIDHPFLNEFQGSGRLTENTARIGRSVLAVAYKVEGRKISKTDAMSNIARDTEYLSVFISYIKSRWDMVDHSFFSQDKIELKRCIDEVIMQINHAHERRAGLRKTTGLSNEPVMKCLFPDGTDGRLPTFWSDYTARCQENTGALRVEAKRMIVSQVTWLSSSVIELHFEHESSRVYATPLKPVPEGYRDDEVGVGDIAMFVGRYLAIGVVDEHSSSPSEGLIMTNYLKVTSMEEQNQTRRGMNRGVRAEMNSVCTFR